MEPIDLLVSNLPPTLPKGVKPGNVKVQLRLISENCGGKILCMSLETGSALIRFPSYTAAERYEKFRHFHHW